MTPELLGVAATAVTAGVVAILVTLAVERLGGELGGLVGTLPSTIVPWAIDVAVTDGPAAAHDALCATPVGMLVNAVFLLAWRAVPPRLPAGLSPGARLGATLAATLTVWAALAAALVAGLAAAGARGVPALATGGAAWLLTLALGVQACRGRPPAPRGGRRVGPGVLALRGLFAAAVIAAALLLRTAGGPLVAGVAAVFPALFLTTMVSVWLAQGEAVPTGAIGPMMLGSASVGAFALLAAWLQPALGPWAGAAAAWVVAAACVTLPARALLRRLAAGPG